MTSAEFSVDIEEGAAHAFAQLSGDWNPLHTDADYAAATRFGRPILHGAYLSGLVSRMAGMYLPGTACLLHSIRLRFLAPVQPPVRLWVRGRLASGGEGEGVSRVEVSIEDARTGTAYAEASYEFSLHEHRPSSEPDPAGDTGLEAGADEEVGAGPAPFLVTGASGALGAAVREALGARGVGVSRSSSGPGLLRVPSLEALQDADLPDRVGGIVHCGWPPPDNQRLVDLVDPGSAVEHHVAGPLRQMLALGRLLADRGTPDAVLILVGSTAAEPGRHNYRMPLYTLSKSLVPVTARILALELAPSGHRCVAITFDVLGGGMNDGMSRRAKVVNKDRSPFGRIPTPAEAAAQIVWALDNRSFLASGANLNLTGGAIP